MRDKSEDGEFFLEILQGDAHSTQKRKRILVIDIEAIEPLQGTRFELRYMKQQSYFTTAKSLKVEMYDSKHLVDLMDCHD